MNMTKPVILTGLRANSDLQIGNYFGAIVPLIEMAQTKSNEFQVSLFVPDLHSFATPIDHTKLYAQTMNNLRTFVAAGMPMDNDNIHIYRQSHISAHSELAWILDCFTGMGEMTRMTQYKDKSSKLSAERISVGLFTYPVLMAADILLYGATYIPVGDDQTQHLEFTRDIAERMNNQFRDLFTVPLPVKHQQAFFGNNKALRIRDLVDPTKKMSKSDELGKGVIFLTDAPAVARKKVMSATTDSLGVVNYDYVTQPGISNLLELYNLLTGESYESWIGQTQYGPLKTAVADAVEAFLADFQSKVAQVSDEAIEAKLVTSEALMREQAGVVLLRAQRAVGLRP